jgi:hypothetical protein
MVDAAWDPGGALADLVGGARKGRALWGFPSRLGAWLCRLGDVQVRVTDVEIPVTIFSWGIRGPHHAPVTRSSWPSASSPEPSLTGLRTRRFDAFSADVSTLTICGLKLRSGVQFPC